MISTSRSRVRSRSLIPVALVSALMLSVPSQVVIHAAEGDLDPTFGTGGIQTVDRVGLAGFEQGKAVALQADGKIVVAADTQVDGISVFALARLHPNGALDSTFGTGGWVTTPFPGGATGRPNAIVIQADGKIVVAGSVTAPSFNEDFGVARYTSDGSLDATFGTGGLVTTDFGATFFESAAAVAVQGDGKIVAAGQTFIAGTHHDFALARYNADGSLDTSFDGDGRVVTGFGATSGDLANAVALQADGRIVAVGVSASDFAAVRYNTDGSLDATFGTGGKATTDFGGDLMGFARAMAIQPDGKIIAGGMVQALFVQDFALVRYETDGTLDSTFGTGGIVTTDLASSGEEIYGVGLQADGKIVAAGRLFVSGSPTNSDFVVARYDAAGVLDTTYGTGGTVITDFGTSSDSLSGMVIQPDGKTLVVGSLVDFTPPGGGGVVFDVALARYEGPPAHDLVFFPHGTDIGPTAGAFTMNQTAPSSQVVLAGASGKSWLSEPVVNGAFIAGSTFTVQLPCPLGVSLSKKVRLATTDASGAGEQVLGEVTTSPRLCSTQSIAVPVAVPATVSARRVKLTITSATAVPAAVVLGSNTFVRATAFVGVP